MGLFIFPKLIYKLGLNLVRIPSHFFLRKKKQITIKSETK